MISGKKERFEKILRVRYKNLKVHKGRRAMFICMMVFYFVFDIIGVGAGITGQPIVGFIMSVLKALLIGSYTLEACVDLFSKDRHNNQVGIEQRSGYDNFDIYMSRLIEIFVGYLFFIVIFAVVNGAIYGGLINGKKTKDLFANTFIVGLGWVPGNMKHRILLGARVNLDFLIIDLWWGLITFIITAAVTIGSSYIMKPVGCVFMGLIFGFGISILIMVASVGTFTDAGFLSSIPGFGPNWWGIDGNLKLPKGIVIPGVDPDHNSIINALN